MKDSLQLFRRHPAFLAYWSGSTLNVGGVWMQIFAINWVLLTLSGKPVTIGLNNMLLAAPALALTLVGGAAADKWDRRIILTITQTVYGILSMVLAYLMYRSRLEVWHVLVASFFSSIAAAYDGPAQQSLMPELVPKESIGAAVALDQVGFNVMRCVAPALAGALVNHVGLAITFVLNAATSVVFLIVVWFVGKGDVTRQAGAAITADLWAGAHHIRQVPKLRRAFGVMTIMTALVMPLVVVLLPVFVKTELSADPSVLASFMWMSGATAAVGALFAAVVGKRSGPLLLSVSIFAIACAMSAMVILHTLGTSTTAFAIASFFQAIVFSLTQGEIQHHTASEVRGRVVALSRMMMRAVVPLAGLAFGAIAGLWTMNQTILIVCIVIMISSLVPLWPEPDAAPDA